MRRTSTSIVTAVAIVAAMASVATAQGTTPDPHSKTPGSSMTAMGTDSEFANKAANGGKHEVEAGKFAAAKASSAEVKAYANRLVTDHTKGNQELMQLMKSKHITAKDGKAEPEPWRSQSGAAFDRAFIDGAIADHEKDIALFEAEAKDGTDADLKAWAAKTLPTLREHLKAAQDLRSKLPSTDQ